ncbi:MAG: hypothetical protein V9G04_19240 [Nocardioides sp.]
MPTGSQRYKQHQVWETLEVKREALEAARYDDAGLEQWRKDVVEWLAEAAKTKQARQPALYLSALDDLSNALNSLPPDVNQFRNYVSNRQPNQPQSLGGLETALRGLPLPPPKDLGNAYVDLLDKEVDARTSRLDELEARIAETETALQDRLDALNRVSSQVDRLGDEIEAQRTAIAEVSSTAESKMTEAWNDTLATWKQDRQAADETRDTEATEHVTALAATRRAAEALAEHAAGDLSAADWRSRGKRERKAAQWIRAAAVAAFLFAGAIGWFIVNEAIRKDFDLTVGDGVLRSSVAVVIAAFGGLLLRESGRHFREADTAEDVALALQALAPFYAGSDETVRLAARAAVGDAVLVKNVLSRFAHRDAAKYSGTELQSLVQEGTDALTPGTGAE